MEIKDNRNRNFQCSKKYTELSVIAAVSFHRSPLLPFTLPSSGCQLLYWLWHCIFVFVLPLFLQHPWLFLSAHLGTLPSVQLHLPFRHTKPPQFKCHTYINLYTFISKPVCSVFCSLQCLWPSHFSLCSKLDSGKEDSVVANGRRR